MMRVFFDFAVTASTSHEGLNQSGTGRCTILMKRKVFRWPSAFENTRRGSKHMPLPSQIFEPKTCIWMRNQSISSQRHVDGEIDDEEFRAAIGKLNERRFGPLALSGNKCSAEHPRSA